MRIGYNTNGFAHHELPAAIELLAELGYESIALTLDHAALNPYSERLPEELVVVRRLLDQRKLGSVIETGARFLLDPRQKHEPTLISPDAAGRRRRIDFLQRAIDIAQQLSSDCVSLWSGIWRPDGGRDASQAWQWLVEGLQEVIDYAAPRGVTIGFEPEPGMFIDTMDRYRQLLERIDAPNLRLTLDIGHLHCQGELPLADQIRRWGKQIVNVHIEDMRQGIHEHLMFGEGEIDFAPVIQALADVRYSGGVHVELSRHSHLAPAAARQAFDFLNPLVRAAEGSRCG